MAARLTRWLVGGPRDVDDPRLFHKISLIAFLAWIGLGADGLSSSAYGPHEAFKALGEHRELAVFLAAATAITVFVISFAYSRIIEHFPSGGGGYVVATKLLGTQAGLVSGCALLIDYVLTITVSIASGADAIFDFLPKGAAHLKVPVECAGILLLVIMNLRGVKESIKVLIPIFLLFLSTHAVMLLAMVCKHGGEVPGMLSDVSTHISGSYQSIGAWALFLIFAKAFSQGAGTFTGIEAVSNGLAIMREPKVETGKRTMTYLAISLAVTAGGILFGYLLLKVHVDPANPDRPLNAALLENLVKDSAFFGNWFVILTLIAEAALLFIAAQTGFIDGPRVMANMALDSWLPHRFSSLSERLTTHYGVLLIGGASLAALLCTHGSVDKLVIMYSINVFITFSLTELGMCKFYITTRKEHKDWKHALPIHMTGLILCVSILTLVISEKFFDGAWLTLLVTLLLIGFCVLIRRYYSKVYTNLGLLPIDIELPPEGAAEPAAGHLDYKQPTAVLLVGSYTGLGIHSFLEIRRMFPDYFKQIIFVSVGVVDSGNFKGTGEVERLRAETKLALTKYVALARKLGFAASSAMGIGNEPVAPAVEQCCELALSYKKAMFFAGKLVFQRETWYQRFLHNETALAIQNNLQWLGYPMVIMPVRIWGEPKKRNGSATPLPGLTVDFQPDSPSTEVNTTNNHSA
ncbi:MAG: APC family permease [Planctomycetota bacterium]